MDFFEQPEFNKPINKTVFYSMLAILLDLHVSRNSVFVMEVPPLPPPPPQAAEIEPFYYEASASSSNHGFEETKGYEPVSSPSLPLPSSRTVETHIPYDSFFSHKNEMYLFFMNRHFHSPEIYKINKFYYIKSKTQLARDKFFLLYNILFVFRERERFLIAFYLAQKYYHILLRTIQRWKWKRMRAYNIDCDLNLTSFSEISPRYLITLSQDGCKYMFNIHDLKRIIINSLTYSNYLYSSAQHPKNPYTNVVFTNTNLYNIFLFMIKNHIPIHSLITTYVMSEFSLKTFYKSAKKELNKFIVDNFLNDEKENTDDFIHYMNEMIEWANDYERADTMGIKIHRKFPKDVLWRILKPYVRLFILGKVLSTYDDHYMNKLEYQLRRFYNYNPSFGSKKSIYTDKTYFELNVMPTEYMFDTNHIPYCYNMGGTSRPP